MDLFSPPVPVTNNDSQNPFENNNFNYIPPPLVPDSSITLPPPVPNSELLTSVPNSTGSGTESGLNTSSALPPPSTPMTDSDFDAFFESLGKTN